MDYLLRLSGPTIGRASRAGPESFIQETWDASIIKSTDHGRNWSATPEIGKAIFPSRLFSNRFFVQHGKDRRGRTNGEYMYATSSDGVWNNGSEMILGRVRRDQIASSTRVIGSSAAASMSSNNRSGDHGTTRLSTPSTPQAARV